MTHIPKNIHATIFNDRKLIGLCSIIFGYSFWLLLSSSYLITTEHNIPVCFHSMPENITIQAPETVRITLRGKRFDLATVDVHNLAAHINAQDFTPGTQQLIITEQELFLPKSIKLVHLIPSNSSIIIEQKV